MNGQLKRILFLSILVLLSGLACLRAQSANNEVFLKPEDLGMEKYVWKVTPQHDEIVVLYVEEWLYDRLTRKQEILLGQEKEGVLCTKRVLVVDGGFFGRFQQPARIGSYDLSFPNGDQRLDHNMLRGSTNSFVSSGGELATLEFVSLEDPKETRKFMYSVYVRSYVSLKERYPKLPPLEDLRKGGLTLNVPQ